MTTVSRASGEQGTPVPAPQKAMLAYAKDLPNICSLVGLLCAVLAIYYAVRGVFPAAMIGMIWAVFFDCSSYQDSQVCQAMVLRSYRLYLDNVCDIWVAVTCKRDDWLVVVTGYQCGIVVGRWSGEDCRLAHRGKGRGFR